MTDSDEFRARWEEYIDSFDRLKLALDPDRWEDLEQAQDEIRCLVREAAEE